MILEQFLRVMNYTTGHARVGTPKICEKVGCSERTAKTHLQTLREAGIIYYVARAGRGKTALYGFRYTREAVIEYNQNMAQKRGANFAPLSVGRYLEKGCNFFPKGVQILPKRGANFAPPSSYVNNIHTKKEIPSQDQEHEVTNERTELYHTRFKELCRVNDPIRALAIVDDEWETGALRAAEN